MQHLLDAPDASTKAGLRDRVLLMLMYNTGARVSEIAALRVSDLRLESGGSVHIRGKGRKQRSVPLWPQTVRLLRLWLKHTDASSDKPLLPNSHDGFMTRAGVAQRLARAVVIATTRDPSLRRCRISPHTIRHTTAMHLLQSGVDLSVIAMWLGHESIQTTHQYLKADLDTKKKALASVSSPQLSRSRPAVAKPLMQFLEGL
jgi:site-specific recombinase XerD